MDLVGGSYLSFPTPIPICGFCERNMKVKHGEAMLIAVANSINIYIYIYTVNKKEKTRQL